MGWYGYHLGYIQGKNLHFRKRFRKYVKGEMPFFIICLVIALAMMQAASMMGVDL